MSRAYPCRPAPVLSLLLPLVVRSLLASVVSLAWPPLPLHAGGPGTWSSGPAMGGGNYPGDKKYAAHMILQPGDGSPDHSRILWFRSEEVTNTTTGQREFLGGQWGWKPGHETCGSFPASPYLESRTVPVSGLDLFCAGHALIGREIAVVGGTSAVTGFYGENQSRILSAPAGTAASTWSDPGNMSLWRWYPTAIPLRDGRILALSGNRHFATVMFGGRRNGNAPASPSGHFVRRQQPVPEGTWDPEIFPLTSTGSPPKWPTPRHGHTMLNMRAGTRLNSDLMFGGRDSADNALDDLWRLFRHSAHEKAEPTLVWSEMIPSGGPPAPRSHHVAIRTTDTLRRMVVFGGLDEFSQPRSDVWRLANTGPTSWEWLEMKIANPLPARFGHAAFYDETVVGGVTRRRMIAFGGAADPGNPQDLRVWELRFHATDPDSATWHEMSVTPGSNPPGPRLGHSLSARQVGDSYQPYTADHPALLFGGRLGSSVYSDSLWALMILADGGARWELLDPGTSASAPGERAWHSAVFDLDHEQATGGRLHVYGGENASGPVDSYAYAIDPFASGTIAWQRWEDRGFTLSGHTAYVAHEQESARQAEVFDPNATGNKWAMHGDATLLQKYYPPSFLVPGGGNGKSRVVSLNTDTLFTYSLDVPASGAAGPWHRLVNGALPFRAATGVQFRPGRLMIAGGYAAVQSGTAPATGATATLNAASMDSAWQSSSAMAARTHHNLVLLPTGQVLAVGGNDHPDHAYQNPVKRPQLWSPNANGVGGTWTPASGGDALAEEPHARGDHGTAILLPDGRVLSAGGETPNDKYVPDLYCPPYLFKNGTQTLADRPAITGASAAVPWKSAFTVCVTDTAKIRSACLIAPAATTHSVDMNQRFVPLTILAAKANPPRIVLSTPASPDSAPPGYYMLFVLGSADGDSVPSVARWVEVNGATSPAPDELELTADLITCESIGPLRWAAPADGGCASKAHEYDLRYSLAPITSSNFSAATPLGAPDPATGGTSQTSYVVTGLAPGTLVYFAGRTRGSDLQWSPLAYAEFATLTSCGGGGAGASAERTRGEGEAANDPTAQSRGATALRGPAQRNALATGTPTARLVAGHAGGAEPRWQLTIEDFAEDPARLAATERAMVAESFSEAEGWVTDVTTPLLPGRAGVRALPGMGRLVFPAGATLESVVLAPRRYALTGANHSRLGDLSGAADGSAAADFVAGDTLTIGFAPATSPGEGEDCLFVVRVPGAALASGARGPSRGPVSGREPASDVAAAPMEFALHPVRPNPFASTATIGFDLPRASRVRIEIFDVQGRRVARLLDEPRPAGRHSVAWNGRRASGATAGPGVYLCRMIAPEFTAERRVTMVP